MLYQLPLPARYQELTDAELRAGIQRIKRQLGKRLVILGHHYQRVEVVQQADVRGDSLKLAQYAAEHQDAEFIVFCGVHFMAESADILTADQQQVILPDLAAGCSMADMADPDDLEAAWEYLSSVSDQPITPVTYVNSAAAVKALVGRADGACCTSSNAKMVLEWALHGALAPRSVAPDLRVRRAGNDAADADDSSAGDSDVGHKVLFVPDQHLGRNTAYAMGWPLDTMVLYDPHQPHGGLTPEQVRRARFILWQGHCSVHALYNTKQIAALRAQPEPWNIIVHPECNWDVVQQADLVGSTEYIVQQVTAAAPGTYWAIGTEVNLTQRLALELPDRHIRSLAGVQCLCSTMYRIDLPHLYWCLEQLAAGNVVNRIVVDPETKRWSRIALERMLALRPAQPVSAR